MRRLSDINDLRSDVVSQIHEIQSFPGVSEAIFFKKPHKWKENNNHCDPGNLQAVIQLKTVDRWINKQY